MNSALQNIIVSVFGFVASMFTALALWQIEELSGYSIYSFSLWFAIPVGAIACGFVSAAGYYMGAVLFGHRPTRMLLLNMVFISISTFFAIYWLAKLGESGAIGHFGYVTAVLQIVGFAIGGFVMFGYLLGLPYCDKCTKYLSVKSKSIRFSANLEKFTEMVNGIVASFNAGEPQKALVDHQKYGEESNPKGGFICSSLLRKQCSTCGVNWLGFSAHISPKSKWEGQVLKEYKFSQYYGADSGS